MFKFEGHADPVTCLAFSPSGKVLASGDESGRLVLWDINRLRPLHTLHLPGIGKGEVAHDVRSVAYSADGSRIVTTTGMCPPCVRVWQAGNLKLLRQIAGGFLTNCALFLHDRQTVVSAGGGLYTTSVARWGVWEAGCPLYRWNLATGRSRKPLDGHVFDVLTLALSPDASRVASGGVDCTVRLWDIARGQEQAVRRFVGDVRSVAFSPLGDQLAVASGKRLHLWDVSRSRGPLRSLSGHTKGVRAVAIHPVGRIVASASDDGTVRFWDIDSGKQQAAFDWGLGRVRAFAFAPDGMTAAAGGASGEIVVWDVDADS